MEGNNEFTVKTYLDEDDLNNEVGTFSLNITISIKITPPGMDMPIVDIVLTPVSRSFTVEEELA